MDNRGAGGHSSSKCKKLTPPAFNRFDEVRRRLSFSSSDSDSSEISSSDLESSSSSSDSSPRSRYRQEKRVRAIDKVLNERKLIEKRVEKAAKRLPISIQFKKTSKMLGKSPLADSDNESELQYQNQHHHRGMNKEKVPLSKNKYKEKEPLSKDKYMEKESLSMDKDKENDKGQGRDKAGGKTSHRGELLKRLRAVEDAIAKKRYRRSDNLA